MTKTTWDRIHWTVTDGVSTWNVTTEGGLTWALRALLAAGLGGLHPIDTGGGRWAQLVERLRDEGVLISDLASDQNGRAGYLLACKAARSKEAAA